MDIDKLKDVVFGLEGVETLSGIIVNIIVIIGGIAGLCYVGKLREKQRDAAFGYLSKLYVRLKFFRENMNVYQDDIMSRFIFKESRRQLSADRVLLVNCIIKRLSESAAETLKFLRDEDGQMPAQKGWVEHFILFTEFLIDCEQLEREDYFKWLADDDIGEKQKQYFNKHLKNIDEMMDMVKKSQLEIENKLFS